jgi:hypothetical protein
LEPIRVGFVCVRFEYLVRLEIIVNIVAANWFWFLLLLLPIPSPPVSNTPQNNTADSLSAEPLPPLESVSKETEYVSCWKKGEDQIKSRLVRSPILVSPDGLRRARVEVKATALKPKNEATYVGRLCFSDSTLFVEGPGGENSKIVYSDSPKVLDGNSIKLVDWAPDGKSLLVEAAQWEYESEGIYTEFFEFSVDSGTIREPDLMQMLAAKFGKDCYSENTVLGFTPDGAIVIALEPDADEVGLENGAKSCVKRKTLVSLNLAGQPGKNLQTIPGNAKLVHYGKFLPLETSK